MNKGTNSYIYYLLSLASLIGACSHLPDQQATELNTQVEPAQQAETAEPAELPQQIAPARRPPASTQQQILEMGSGEFIASSGPEPEQQISSVEGDITLNFQDTDVREFIKVIMGDVLNTNYVIDPKVSGKVTIETSNPVNKDELLPLLEEILAMNGIAVVNTDGLFKILPKNQAVRGNIAPTVIRKKTAGGYAIRIIPLRFIAAQEMQKILEPFIPDGGNLRIDKKRNLLITSGTTQELDLIQETIDIFDVDWLRGMSMGLYPLDYVDPKALKKELDSIIGAIEGDSSKELLGGLVRIVSIERLNSILLISSTPTALREVEIWIYRLDRQSEHVGQRLFVYNVQNAKASELADILSQVFSSSSASQTTQTAAAELAPGLTPAEISSNSPQSAGQSGDTSPRAASVSEGVSLPASGSIKIIADDVRNALVVLATPQDYKMVEAAIKKLDVVPLQVLIEASILEVTLRDDLSYGVEWFFKNSFGNGKQGRGTLDLGSAGIAALSPSFSYTIVDPADQVRIALNALENESEVKVLSSPSLMVLNNKTATINVGDEIPVPTRQSISNLDPNAPTVNEIQFRKTGVTLTVTPRVNSGGLVTMEIRQEVSSAIATTTSEIEAPTIQNRLIESVVAINSGETVVLGGLIQETRTNSESGIPFLHRIPIIGKLFGQTTEETIRTELLILITPRVVSNRNDARDITDEYRRKLRGITPLEIKQTVKLEQTPS